MANEQNLPAKVKRESILTTLKKNEFQTALNKILPRMVRADSFIGAAIHALALNPSLLECSKLSFFNAVLSAGRLGLEVDTPLQHAHLVPFKKKDEAVKNINLIPGYRGLIHICYRNPKTIIYDASIVYKKDRFDVIKGTDNKLIHVPYLEDDRGDPWLYYAIIHYANGGSVFELMNNADMKKIMAKSKSQTGPWATDPDRMKLKSVIKRHINKLDLGYEPAAASTLDNQADQGEDQVPLVDINDFGITEGDIAEEEQKISVPVGGNVGRINNHLSEKANGLKNTDGGGEPPADNSAGESGAEAAAEPPVDNKVEARKKILIEKVKDYLRKKKFSKETMTLKKKIEGHIASPKIDLTSLESYVTALRTLNDKSQEDIDNETF
jgi:recombination protein RecT